MWKGGSWPRSTVVNNVIYERDDFKAILLGSKGISNEVLRRNTQIILGPISKDDQVVLYPIMIYFIVVFPTKTIQRK